MSEYTYYTYLDEGPSQLVDAFPSNVPPLSHSSCVHACGYVKSSNYDLQGSNQMEMARFPMLQINKLL